MKPRFSGFLQIHGTSVLLTVFDLISGLSAYKILGPKNRFKYFVCVYPGCKTVLPKIVTCEGPLIMMTGSLKKKKKKKDFFF